MTGQGAGPTSATGARQGRGRASVGRCCGVGGVFGGVGAQVFEGLLALGHELFERRQEQLGGRRPTEGGAVGRDGQAFHLWDWQVLQAGAPPAVGGVGAMGAPGASGSTGVETPAAARTAIHRLQEEAVSGAPTRRAVGGEVLLVQELLDLLIRWLLQLRHKTQHERRGFKLKFQNENEFQQGSVVSD